MVEHHDAPGSALGLHQGFHLGVIGAADFGLVEEIAHPGVVAHEAEAVAIERELIAREPRVADHDAARVRSAAGAHVERTRPAGIGEKLLAVVDDVVDGCFDGLGRGFLFYDGNHGELRSNAGVMACSVSRYKPQVGPTQRRHSDAGS